MKRLSWYGLALALVSALWLGTLQADDKEKKDDKEKAKLVADEDKKFEGTWQVTKEIQNGQPQPEDRVAGTTFEFKGKKYEQKVDGNVVEAGTQDLDPTKKPKHMDVTVTDGEGTTGLKQLAIYEIDGDTVKACFAPHGSTERPSKFESTADSRLIYIEMKRKKAGAAK